MTAVFLNGDAIKERPKQLEDFGQLVPRSTEGYERKLAKILLRLLRLPDTRLRWILAMLVVAKSHFHKEYLLHPHWTVVLNPREEK